MFAGACRLVWLKAQIIGVHQSRLLRRESISQHSTLLASQLPRPRTSIALLNRAIATLMRSWTSRHVFLCEEGTNCRSPIYEKRHIGVRGVIPCRNNNSLTAAHRHCVEVAHDCGRRKQNCAVNMAQAWMGSADQIQKSAAQRAALHIRMDEP
jgi:hypothetical protein